MVKYLYRTLFLSPYIISLFTLNQTYFSRYLVCINDIKAVILKDSGDSAFASCNTASETDTREMCTHIDAANHERMYQYLNDHWYREHEVEHHHVRKVQQHHHSLRGLVVLRFQLRPADTQVEHGH